MATTFGTKTPTVSQTDGTTGRNIISNDQTPQNAPSASGARKQPKDSYVFIVNSRAEFRAIFNDTDKPVNMDTGTKPIARVFNGCDEITSIEGELALNQTYEYAFYWDIPDDLALCGSYTVHYIGTLGGVEYTWGHEYFRINLSPQNIKLKQPAYATTEELRQDKFNIDTYLPRDLRQDVIARDALLQQQLVTSSNWLNGQLNLRDFHSSYNDNFNLYVRYYTIWSILGQSQGEDGSAVSTQTLNHWEKKWKAVLKQIKMHSQLSNIPTGRA